MSSRFETPATPRAELTYSDGTKGHIPVEGLAEFMDLATAVANNKGIVLRYGALAPPTAKGPRVVQVTYQEWKL